MWEYRDLTEVEEAVRKMNADPDLQGTMFALWMGYLFEEIGRVRQLAEQLETRSRSPATISSLALLNEMVFGVFKRLGEITAAFKGLRHDPTLQGDLAQSWMMSDDNLQGQRPPITRPTR